MNSNQVTIFIYFYEGEDMTRDLLHSIKCATKYDNYKVVLIDDGSPSKIGEKFKEEGYEVIVSSENRGIPHSINLALRYPGSLKVISQNDIVVSDGWLSSLIDFWKKYPEFLYVSPFAFNDLDYNYESFNEKVKELRHEFEDLISSQFWGGLWLCDKRITEKNGYYDENLKYFADDCDWCMRLNMNKIPTASTGSSLILHKGSKTTPRFSNHLGDCMDYLNKKWAKIKSENKDLDFNRAYVAGTPYKEHDRWISDGGKYFHTENCMRGELWI